MMSEDEMFRFLDFLGHQTACEILVDKEWKDIVKKDSSAIFVTDGIADEDGWRKAEVKVLYFGVAFLALFLYYIQCFDERKASSTRKSWRLSLLWAFTHYRFVFIR